MYGEGRGAIQSARPGKRHGKRQDGQKSRRPPGTGAGEGDHGGGRQPQAAEGPEGVLRRQHEQGQERQGRARPGTQEVGAVNGADALAKPGKGEADTGGGTKERQRQQQVDVQKGGLLAQVPDDLQGIERHPPGKRETRHGGKSEGGGEAGERPMEPGLQPAPGKDQERAAGADAQQRQG